MQLNFYENVITIYETDLFVLFILLNDFFQIELVSFDFFFFFFDYFDDVLHKSRFIFSMFTTNNLLSRLFNV